jgi:MFS family permease
MSTGMRSFPASAAGKSAKAVAVFHGLALIAFFAASSAPTPLYRFYQEKWSFSPVVLTVIFGAYALALLLALLTMGSLSDHVGRKPVIFGALLLQIVAMALFITADGVPSLIIARVVQGFSTGMAGSAFGAALIDVDRDRGALANSLTPLLGMAFGALGSSALVDFAPRPMQLVYLVLLVVFAIQAALVVFLPETVVKRPGALASLVPRINVPMQARRALLRCSPIIIAVWALGGFYLSLVPSLVRASARLT